VTSGGSSTITWTTTNATSCNASGAWLGSKAINDNETITNITSTGTYTLTCTGPGGSSGNSATVTVTGGTGTVIINKTIGGYVTSSPAGINCGISCSASFSLGSIVALTAHEDSAYWKFVGWQGACSGSAYTYNLTVSNSNTCSAVFAPRPFQYREF
jgi:hypothetical protein